MSMVQFGKVTKNLQQETGIYNLRVRKRIQLEKPYGEDELESPEKLNSNFNYFGNIWPKLNQECVVRILSYLLPKEFMNVFSTCKNLYWNFENLKISNYSCISPVLFHHQCQTNFINFHYDKITLLPLPIVVNNPISILQFKTMSFHNRFYMETKKVQQELLKLNLFKEISDGTVEKYYYELLSKKEKNEICPEKLKILSYLKLKIDSIKEKYTKNYSELSLNKALSNIHPYDLEKYEKITYSYKFFNDYENRVDSALVNTMNFSKIIVLNPIVLTTSVNKLFELFGDKVKNNTIESRKRKRTS